MSDDNRAGHANPASPEPQASLSKNLGVGCEDEDVAEIQSISMGKSSASLDRTPDDEDDNAAEERHVKSLPSLIRMTQMPVLQSVKARQKREMETIGTSPHLLSIPLVPSIAKK